MLSMIKPCSFTFQIKGNTSAFFNKKYLPEPSAIFNSNNKIHVTSGLNSSPSISFRSGVHHCEVDAFIPNQSHNQEITHAKSGKSLDLFKTVFKKLKAIQNKKYATKLMNNMKASKNSYEMVPHIKAAKPFAKEGLPGVSIASGYTLLCFSSFFNSADHDAMMLKIIEPKPYIDKDWFMDMVKQKKLPLLVETESSNEKSSINIFDNDSEGRKYAFSMSDFLDKVDFHLSNFQMELTQFESERKYELAYRALIINYGELRALNMGLCNGDVKDFERDIDNLISKKEFKSARKDPNYFYDYLIKPHWSSTSSSARSLVESIEKNAWSYFFINSKPVLNPVTSEKVSAYIKTYISNALLNKLNHGLNNEFPRENSENIINEINEIAKKYEGVSSKHLGS